MRTFALPRLKSPEITAERFNISKKFNLSEHLTGSLAKLAPGDRPVLIHTARPHRFDALAGGSAQWRFIGRG